MMISTAMYVRQTWDKKSHNFLVSNSGRTGPCTFHSFEESYRGSIILAGKILFVNACYLLCRRIVTRDQVNEADDLLNKFSLRLYGPERMYL